MKLTFHLHLSNCFHASTDESDFVLSSKDETDALSRAEATSVTHQKMKVTLYFHPRKMKVTAFVHQKMKVTLHFHPKMKAQNLLPKTALRLESWMRGWGDGHHFKLSRFASVGNAHVRASVALPQGLFQPVFTVLHRVVWGGRSRLLTVALLHAR